MKFNVALIPGDGIGPEAIEQAVKVLDKVGEIFSHEFKYTKVCAGGAAVDKYDKPLPEETLDICKKSDAVLLGAIGGDKWSNLPLNKKPEKALLTLRKELGLYANLRPAVLQRSLKNDCPLKSELVKDGIDMIIIRELTGGMYSGEKGVRQGKDGKEAYDVECYSENTVRRIASKAFEIALKRRKKVTSIDKANVLESSMLWRNTVNEVAKNYPEIELEHIYVDSASMKILKNPGAFDVVLASNAFGDIIADEASQIVGSIGTLPAASLGEKSLGMFEPNQIHSSVQDIAGKNTANPIAVIMSSAMMLRYSFNLNEEASAIEKAVSETLENGYRTRDMMTDGMKLVGTREMGDAIVKLLSK
ncbi:3-isopropylmalate dehydrogenase [Clostridium sp. AWRP]|uniref:3-isopropylmalate dehydrogenase n=1 Tax=Clostridium sp. AWRP TaxID=2212991 RepID=UPI000FD812AD|nr:3-isopropylmalate dehydrogenase [Clostridium sp. AWRP]AZV58630.1 3-isopropylmalate dehydrogenase [Clostridium sp. AWRP]